MISMPYKDSAKRKEHHKKYMREVWYPLNRSKHIKYVDNLKKKIAKGLKLSGIKIDGDKLEYVTVSQNKHDTSISFGFEDYPDEVEIEDVK